MSARKQWLAKFLGPAIVVTCVFLATILGHVGLAAGDTTTSSSASTPPTITEPPTVPTMTTPPTTIPTTTTPPGNEGCTPGFWKNHLDAWVGFSPDQTVGSVFTSAPASVSGLTLLAALDLGGGGVEALTRQAIAALLNAASPDVDYPLTTAQVIAMVDAAFASGDATQIESLKDALDEFNNLTAPGFCD